MKISVLLDNLADDLNDNEVGHRFTTWTKDQLRAYVSDAIQLVFSTRPDLFLETRIVKLTPCHNRQDICECAYIRRVIGQTDAYGTVVRPLHPRSMDEQFLWTGKSCVVRPTANFKLQGYAIDKAGDNLYVFPAPPPGIDAYISVECAVRPTTEITDTMEINSEVAVAAKQWALFNAKMVDAEVSPEMSRAAVVHEAEFWRILGVQKDTKVIIHRRADNDRDGV